MLKILVPSSRWVPIAPSATSAWVQAMPIISNICSTNRMASSNIGSHSVCYRHCSVVKCTSFNHNQLKIPQSPLSLCCMKEAVYCGKICVISPYWINVNCCLCSFWLTLRYSRTPHEHHMQFSITQLFDGPSWWFKTLHVSLHLLLCCTRSCHFFPFVNNSSDYTMQKKETLSTSAKKEFSLPH